MPGDAANILALVGRLFLGCLFVYAGLRHAFIYPPLLDMLKKRGVWFAPIVLAAGSIFEVAAGAALMVGWQVPLAALGLILFTIAATLMFLNFWSMRGPERESVQNAAAANVAIIGGLMLAAAKAL